MKTFFSLTSILLLLTMSAFGQDHSFAFGKVSYAELDMKVYERDSTAVAVVLDEFGEAYFDLESLNKIIFQYHIKIKVLRESGRQYADFEIPTRKASGSRQEFVAKVKGSSFNRDGNNWKESPLQSKNIYTDNVDENYSLTKFAIPDVRVGSVIEVSYELQSPFTHNFVPWEFQSGIPKMKSEFWAQYPAFYQYNITLKGYQSLTKNEATVINKCAVTGGTGLTTTGADCSQFKFGMTNIPAFKDEEYMTARSNFLSAVHFELSQIKHPDGQIDRITTEWKDAEQELRESVNFGAQIKKARNLYEDQVKMVVASSTDPMVIARQLYDHIKTDISWNENFGFFTDNGVKKTFELKKGNVADINLSLLGALQEAKIDAEPVLLATRARGLPIKLYPVLSDFNYVIVQAKINNEVFLLDATSPLHTFGFIPERCLNGQGRAMGPTSAWIDLKPNTRERTIFDLKLTASPAGEISGALTISHSGYAGYYARRSFLASNSEKEYIENRKSQWTGLDIKNYTIENGQDIEKPLIEKFQMTFEDQVGGANIIYFQPFMFNQFEKNPFGSTERLYPVDFGAPQQVIYLVTMDIADGYVPEDVPADVSLTLPGAGGTLRFAVNKFPGKLNLSCTLTLNKAVYTSEEYHYLRELYARYISILQSQFVLKKG